MAKEKRGVQILYLVLLFFYIKLKSQKTTLSLINLYYKLEIINTTELKVVSINIETKYVVVIASLVT